MALEVKELTKVYKNQVAVNELSFEIGSGSITGFLGPNGAGKSTTMKMVSCYVEPTGGTASVCGYDILESPLDVRKQIGYLPENNPLYLDMYVKEYLNFVAGIHRLSNKAQRVSAVIEQTGLGKEQHKVIGALSKGYRQRVGLAQAIIHDPKVLILDEPTSGLDMNQLIDIRALIKELGKEKTVILSTHIMQEVQAVCDRVIIISDGKKIADDPIEKLSSRVNNEKKVVLEVQKLDNKAALAFEKISGVENVKTYAKTIEVTYLGNEDLRPAIFKTAVDNDLILLGMHQDALDVETIFQQLTKSAAND